MEPSTCDLDKKPAVISCDHGLSDCEIEFVVGFVIGWIEGYTSVLCEHESPTEPFFRSIHDSLTVYVFDASLGFFEEHFQDYVQYNAKVADLKQKCPLASVMVDDSQKRLDESRRWIELAKQQAKI